MLANRRQKIGDELALNEIFCKVVWDFGTRWRLVVMFILQIINFRHCSSDGTNAAFILKKARFDPSQVTENIREK
jgi:hypothetical protein